MSSGAAALSHGTLGAGPASLTERIASSELAGGFVGGSGVVLQRTVKYWAPRGRAARLLLSYFLSLRLSVTLIFLLMNSSLAFAFMVRKRNTAL